MPYADPEARRQYHLRWERENRDKRNPIAQRYREKSQRRSFRDSDARRRYGFSSYAEMCEYRNRPCEICGQLAGKMCIDHDGPPAKFNGTFRGVLCQQCNTRLGWFESKREVILAYLEKENASGK